MKFISLSSSVHQGDCSPSDSPSDESHHRVTELDHMEAGLEDQDEERLGDGMATPPLYLSQARSFSRLSRMESHRVRAHIRHLSRCIHDAYILNCMGPGVFPDHVT